jgi:hypothetical protein
MIETFGLLGVFGIIVVVIFCTLIAYVLYRFGITAEI